MKSLPHQPRVAAIVRDVVPDPLPEILENPGGAGEVDAGQIDISQQHFGDLRPVTGEHVDDTRRETRLRQEIHRQRGRELLCRRGFPDDDVAHQGHGRGQVARDRGAVERRDRVDETFERTVVGSVPDALGVGHRLLREDLAGEMHVEAPEVGQLAGRVDLGLVRRLCLAQHGRRVDPGPPRAGQQVGGSQENGGAIIERHRAPVVRSGQRSPDRVDRVLLGGVGRRGQHPLVVERSDDLEGLSGRPPRGAADHCTELQRAVERPQCHGETLALGAAGSVVEHGLVDRQRRMGDGVHVDLSPTTNGGRELRDILHTDRSRARSAAR
jgi:hypothetical protein